MDKKKHINILIDRVSLCYYKIEKAVFYFTDLFKIMALSQQMVDFDEK